MGKYSPQVNVDAETRRYWVDVMDVELGVRAFSGPRRKDRAAAIEAARKRLREMVVALARL